MKPLLAKPVSNYLNSVCSIYKTFVVFVLRAKYTTLPVLSINVINFFVNSNNKIA